MSDKAKILLQLDTDVLPSSFDRITALDAGADHVLAYGGVRLDQVAGLIHGAIFTRGSHDLHRTAVFVGGGDLAAGEQVFAEVQKQFLPQFGLRVSVMLDSNGANTTAVAAVRAAANHLDLSTTTALVLGGTGPVGRRVARLLARAGAVVRIGSRQRDRAEAVAQTILSHYPKANVTAVATASSGDGPAALAGASLVVTAGAAGVVLLPKKMRANCPSLKVMIDLNAVPPGGIEGVEVGDAAAERDGLISYGALGVGGPKMKLHKRAVAKMFERSDLVFDAEALYDFAAESN